MSNTVTQEQVERIVGQTEITYYQHGNKTLVGVCELPNGWIEVLDASCVDPSNFDVEIGKSIIEERLINKIWELEGYVLQTKQSN